MTFWQWPTIRTYQRLWYFHRWLSRWHLRRSRWHEHHQWAYEHCATAMAKEILAEAEVTNEAVRAKLKSEAR